MSNLIWAMDSTNVSYSNDLIIANYNLLKHSKSTFHILKYSPVHLWSSQEGILYAIYTKLERIENSALLQLKVEDVSQSQTLFNQMIPYLVIKSIAVNEENTMMALGGLGIIIIVNFLEESWQLWDIGDNYVTTLTFSLDGKTIFSGEGECCIKQIEVSSGKMIKKIEISNSQYVLKLHRNLTTIVACIGNLSNRTVELFDLYTNLELGKIEAIVGLLGDVSFSPSNEFIAIADMYHQLIIWDMREKKSVVKLSKTGELFARKIEFSPDSKKLAVIHNDNVLRIWDTSLLEIMDFGKVN